MPKEASTSPLTEIIAAALSHLRFARVYGDIEGEFLWQERLDGLLDTWPRS
jgi:hypothetical protein